MVFKTLLCSRLHTDFHGCRFFIAHCKISCHSRICSRCSLDSLGKLREMTIIRMSIAVVLIQCGLIDASFGQNKPNSQQLAQNGSAAAERPTIVLHGWLLPTFQPQKVPVYSETGARLVEDDLSDAAVDGVRATWLQDYSLVKVSDKSKTKSWWVKLHLLKVEYCGSKVAMPNQGTPPTQHAFGMGSGERCPQ
jgi:hypothetical protein